MDKHLKEAREYFQSLSTEELKQVLVEAGFEVRAGSGKVIFTESVVEEKVGFTIKGTLKPTRRVAKCKQAKVSSFPVAC